MVKKAGNRKEGKAMPGKVRVQDAESEEEDKRFAAAASMPVGQNEVEDDEVEESSDEGESQSANEEGDGGLAKFMRHDKGHDKLWADPTHAEMKGLKEAELHFKSSLLRLQMDELKAQVSVNYAKTSALESWLHRLKGILEALPAAKLSTSSLGEETLLDKFEFRAPGAVHMVGSYLLRTVTRPDLTIDLLVEMPAEILHHKDFLNRKYLHKRQLYLGHIATQLRSHASVAAVHFSAFRSDTSKPCVLLKPAGLSGLSSKFSVRILAAPPPETFPLARFRPSRNNVRLPGVTDIAEQPPTPTYNTAVAEDLRMVHHLQLMHAEFCNCVALAETAMLLKVWLRQRYFNSAPDSLNGFTVSILLLYLLQHRKIARSMSCYHMLRATFVFLSNKDTLEQGIHLTPAADATCTPREAIAEFVGGGQPVLLDDSLSINLLARVTSSALKEIQHEARAAVLCLEQEDGSGGFTALMLRRVSAACKYDEFLLIRIDASDLLRPGGGQWQESEGVLGEEEPAVAAAVAVQRAALRIVEEALGNRLHFARVVSREAVEAPLAAAGGAARMETKMPDSLEKVVAAAAWGSGGRGEMLIGLLLNADTAAKKVERGPPAEEADAARRFRAFWGDKSELRRFKDGGIQETLVWSEADGPEGPMSVPAAMAGFALRRHLPCITRGLGVAVKGCCWWAGTELFKSSGGAAYGPRVEVSRAQHSGELTTIGPGEVDAAGAFDLMGKALMALGYRDGLTLPVMAVQAVSTQVRGLGATLLAPHKLCWHDPAAAPQRTVEQGVGKRKRGSGAAERVALTVPAIDCVVTLQRQAQESGKWTDDLEAVRKLSAAIYLCMANALNKGSSEDDDPAQPRSRSSSISSMFVAKAFLDHLQILGLGYAFRVRIWNEREVRLLHQLKRKPEAEALEIARFHRPQHAAAISALAHKFPSMAEAVRLCKRWLSVQMLAATPCSHSERSSSDSSSSTCKPEQPEGVADEVVELLVAYTYTRPVPFAAPATPLAGFLRFLLLLAVTDWDTGALVLDLSCADEQGPAQLSPQAYEECLEAAEKARAAGGRSQRPVPVCLCTAADRGGVRWTSQGVSGMLWARLLRLARSSLSAIARGLGSGAEAAVSRSLACSMRRDVGDFDVVIRLHAADGLLKVPSLGSHLFKNTCRKLQSSLLVGLSPIGELLMRLRRLYGRHALFWADSLHADCIVVLWLPTLATATCLSVAHSENVFPLVLAEEAGGVTGGREGGGSVVPDTVGMLCGFKRLGEGLVKEIQVLSGARVVG